MYEEQEGYKCPAQHNVTYNLWKLGHHKVLIRCGIHTAKFNPKNPKTQVSVSIQVYLVKFNPKKNPTSECTLLLPPPIQGSTLSHPSVPFLWPNSTFKTLNIRWMFLSSLPHPTPFRCNILKPQNSGELQV